MLLMNGVAEVKINKCVSVCVCVCVCVWNLLLLQTWHIFGALQEFVFLWERFGEVGIVCWDVCELEHN